MNDQTERIDDTTREDGELERLLRAYAGARLSPDQWASLRMRAAVIEHGRAARAEAATRWTWRRALRPATYVTLVALLAVGTGATAAFAASPGGPLYDARLWVETAVLNITVGGPDAQIQQMDDRFGDVTNAVDNGNADAANAAANAYTTDVTDATQAAQTRADLLLLQASLQRQLTHLQGLSHDNPKAQANLNQLIAKVQAALSQVNAKLAALPVSNPSP